MTTSQKQQMMSAWLEDTLARLPKARVTVFGDFCLDCYWELDPDCSETSIETGLPSRRVKRQRYSLGGAGNVAANLIALGVKQVNAIGAVGDDPFGREMLRLLHALSVNTTGMPICPDWPTLAYAKPHLNGIEQNRVDFGGVRSIPNQTEARLADCLRETAADVTVLNQQIPLGVSSTAMIERINGIIARGNGRFIVDSRDHALAFRGAMLKINTAEARRISNEPHMPVEEICRSLSRQVQRPIFLTRGDAGILVADGDLVSAFPAMRIAEPTDTVGAGDTVVAAIAAVLAAGGDHAAAAKLANLAASVTVRKLHTTGTATPDEIRAADAQQARTE